MVFYRKYRPQKIEDLDSKDIRDKLYSILSVKAESQSPRLSSRRTQPSASVPHAFLFTGPKGLGKTSTARIVAKSINCEKKDKGSMEPCNDCDQCTSISKGTNLDVLEIDGASNRGIDEIRDLREKVKLSPLSSKKKVYIIDEVHMLTAEAFNALLKTLEEPPDHVVFIMCTTEPHKIPATILSRCLHIQFKKATPEELVRSFERILKGEKLKGDEVALRLIANLSDGSFRDGAKILEELSLLSNDQKITKDLVEQKYQVSTVQYQIAQMIRNLENKDTKGALEVVSKLTNEGIELSNFMQELIRTLHNNLLFKVGVNSAVKNNEFKIENSKLEIEEIRKIIDLFSRAFSEVKYAVLPQIPMEMAIIEWCEENPPAGGEEDPKPSVQKEEKVSEEKKEKVFSSKKTEEKPPVIQARTTQQDMSSYSEYDALWQALIDKVKTHNYSVAGVLRGCNIKNYDGKDLLIETNFKFHKDKLSEARTLSMLQKVVLEITKKNVNISVIIKKSA